ncbi:MAG TPA: tRNA (guanosine(46)-N7)-methyltransferase TrmB [Chitinophagaceae bacterium]|nr:tRNA (guanosine(46)-N7)-methyltransferase TrmB [Chitinophagaceae bacterium]HAN39771.1 tRNA (guanosine(46)-N7)-methyltransferase TrmB [Chitinophagaceae bacterium]
MAYNKLERFAAIKTFKNVFEYPTDSKGKWQQYFPQEQPITLELACGKGEYAVGLAALYSQRNFIGVDVKGNRMYVGAKHALANELHNVCFLRTQIEQIEQFFGANEIAEIWITFPDPQLRWSKMKKRLTHPRFLRRYQQFLAPNGLVHLKTDSPDLYNFTKAVINLYDLPLLHDTDDLYQSSLYVNELRIKTHYEGLDIAGSKKIHYLQFQLPHKELPITLDDTLKNMFRDDAAIS